MFVNLPKTIKFEIEEFGFSVKYQQTRKLLLCCDNTSDLYPVSHQSSPSNPFALLSFSHSTWHRRLGHPGDDVIRKLESRHLISCNKSKSSTLSFHFIVLSLLLCIDIIHMDVWTSHIPSVSGIRYYDMFQDHFSHLFSCFRYIINLTCMILLLHFVLLLITNSKLTLRLCNVTMG